MKLNFFIAKKATIAILLKLLISMFLFSSFSSGQNLVKVAGETSDFVYSFDKPKEDSKIGESQSDVGLSSGNFEMTIPLFSLPQRGPLLQDFSLSLNYSSNMSTSINELNKYSQAAWVGLGWSLGIGAIIIENNGTKDFADNEYYYFDGYSTIKIIKTFSEIAEYTLEDNPYFKFTFTYGNGVTEVTAVNEDGIIYKFGSSTESSSNRKILCWEDRVGNGYGANGTSINNRLDLESISDITGNNIIQFYYEQESSSLNGYYYTRASYPDYVIDSYGRKIDFVLSTRENDEYEENFLTTFQTYETKYLDKIELYETETASQPYQTIDLVYPTPSNFFGVGSILKRKLSEVKFIAPNTNEISTTFDYILSGDNIGALNQITYPTGGIKTISYDKVIDVEQSQLTTLFNRNRTRINANEYEVRSSGSTIVVLDRGEYKFYLKKWVGEWITKVIDVPQTAYPIWYPKFEVSENHVAYYIPATSNPDYSQLTVYSWDDKRMEWHQSLNENIAKNGGSGDAQLALSNTIAAVMRDEGSNDRILSWQWQRNEWERLSDITSNEELFFSNNSIFQVRNNTMLYGNSVPKLRNGVPWMFLHVYYFNSNSWELKNNEFSPFTYAFEAFGTNKLVSATIQDDYFSVVATNYLNGANLYLFEVISGELKSYRFRNAFPYSNIYALYSTNHLIYKTSTSTLNIINRNSSGNWPIDQDNFLIDYSQQVNLPGDKYDIQLNDEFIVGITQDDATNIVSVKSFHWNSSTRNWDEYGFITSDFPAQAYDIDLVLSGNHIVTKSLENNYLRIFVWEWNGTGWNSPIIYTDTETTMQFASEREGYSPKLLVGSNLIGTSDFFNGAIKCWTIQGNSKWNSNIIRYSVNTITDTDGSDNYITSYDFDSPAYSNSFNSVSYGGVNIIPPASQGSMEYTFHNSKTEQPRLSGMQLEKKVYKQGNPNPVEIVNNTWDIFTYGKNDNPPIPDDIHNAYSVRLINEYKVLDGVSSNTAYDYLNPNDINGKPKKITESNSDGSVRITTIKYACSVYETMSEWWHMLTQEIQRTTYENSINISNARSSSVTTWKDWGNDVWLPDRKFSWKYSGTNYNLPAFNDWNDEGVPVSSEWILSSKAISRDSYGNMENFIDGNETSMSTIWGYNSIVPVSKIINSKKGECGYLSIEEDWQTWESGGSSVSLSSSHTGLKSSFSSNDYGPTKNFYFTEGIDINKTYIFETWVNRTSGIATAAIQVRNSSSQDVSIKSVLSSDQNGWQRISVKITPAEMALLSDINHLRVWCGFIGSGNAGYIDDARFYPADAQMITYTYNPVTLQPTSYSDANNNPTFFEYDGFGRLTYTKNAIGEAVSLNSYSADLKTTSTIIYQSPNPDGFTQNITDALRRPKEQKIQYEEGFITSSQTYDAAGRLKFDYLPNGQAKEFKYYEDPLSKVEQQGMLNLSPWRIDVSGEHPVKYEYGSNDGSEGYPASTLYKTTVIDENGIISTGYKDLFGNVVRKVSNVTLSGNKTNNENLTVTFEYDILGNLIKSKPPKGNKDNTEAYNTRYWYNTLSQLTQKTSPDAGTVEYLYDKSGNLRFIKDANQTVAGKYTYNKYDAPNRIIETGEYIISGSFTQENADDNDFPSDGNRVFLQKLIYDCKSDDYEQNNLKGKLSKSISYNREGSEVITTYYSYNNYGWIEWMIHKMPGLSDKKISYEYDRQGNITKKSVSDLALNTLYTFYNYDMVGRLREVHTNTIDSETGRIKEAEYTYNADGTIKRLQLANSQGMDYVYNERSWLTQINHQNLDGLYQGQPQDPGRDGFDSGLPGDKFGAIIGYNNQGHIGAGTDFTWQPQYNGNISWLITRTKDAALQYAATADPQPCIGYLYNYDGVNRLTKVDFGYYNPETSSWINYNMYDLPLMSYDANGNIDTLQRNGSGGSLMDNFIYNYTSGKNRLESINWRGSYTYDYNGNMKTDSYNMIGDIKYNISNLPEEITKNDNTTIYYWYDGSGNRIRKQVVIPTETTDEIYVYGKEGETEAVFDANGSLKFFNIVAGTNNIGRLEAAAYELRLKNTTLTGTKTGNNIITEGTVTVTGTAALKAGNSIVLKPGFHAVEGCSFTAKIDTNLMVEPERFYYLKDHLGSIRVTVDDVGEIVSYDDYDPWGMQLDGRSGNFGLANDKYKFTSKERDVETNYDYFGARYYDSRNGRWLQVDPLAEKYPGISPYAYALNNPVRYIDPDGMDVTSEDKERLRLLAQRLNEIYKGANISVIENKNEDGEVTSYSLATDIESDFDWGQNEFTSAMFDAIHSADVSFNVIFADNYKGDNGVLSRMNNGEGAFLGEGGLGGGKIDPSYMGANIWISRNEQDINSKNYGIVFMHEALGHGHPAGGDDARIIEQKFYGQKLGSWHRGYRERIGWKQTSLWNYFKNSLRK